MLKCPGTKIFKATTVVHKAVKFRSGGDSKWKRRSVGAPSRDVPSLSLFQTKSPCNSHYVIASRRHVMTSRDIMMPRRDVVTHIGIMYHDTQWHHVSSQLCPQETRFSVCFQPSDLDLWPMTLTYQLIQGMIMVHSSTKSGVRKSNGSGVRALTDTRTHRHTRPILYPRPLTREGIIYNL